MTATQVIAEIDRLPLEEKETVIAHVHDIEAGMIPNSFLQGMAEAQRNELVAMYDEDFVNPPR